MSERHIVVVDDDVDTRDMLRLVLEFEGAVVTEALTAAEALSVVNSSTIDVLLTEASLNGVGLMKEIRALPRSVDLCVIALTGRKELVPELEKLGFTAVLVKPIDTTDLCAFILACLTG